MSLLGGGVSLREFCSVQEELLYLREQVDNLSSNKFNLLAVIDRYNGLHKLWDPPPPGKKNNFS